MPTSGTTDAAPRHWNLFLDDRGLARTTGLDRVVHHPRPLGIVIPADKPWETVGASPILVERRTDGSFVAYYTAMWWDSDRAASLEKGFREDRAHHVFHHVAYAESADGIRWEKPNLGLVEGPASLDWGKSAPFPSPSGVTRDNNLGVPFVPVADLGRWGNVSDPSKHYAVRLAPEEAEGVGAAWSHSPRGYFASQLPDFLHDGKWRSNLTDSGGNFNPRRNALHYWDPLHDEWVTIEQGVVGHWLPSREIARFASKDLVHWTSTSVLYPDAADPHRQDYYDEAMSMHPFCAEGAVFGLLSWFHSDRTHPDGGPQLDPVPEHPARWPFCRKGTNEMRITISRDGGHTWDRTSSREPWIPHGTEHDNYDRLVIGPTSPVRVGDEDWFYLGVINGDHLGIRNDAGQTAYYRNRLPRHQIALYIQKHNRYVSLRARNRPEVLITEPMVVAGDTLQLNVDGSRGEVRVGAARPEPILTYNDTTPTTAPHFYVNRQERSFQFADCVPVREDGTEITVRFAEGRSLGELRGQSVRLLFEVVDADLYGFRFADGKP